MYFSGLKKLIESLEEKRFYDVALLYLSARGYEQISIVDGPGDGGRDVVTSRKDLRIQLSVRKDWEKKINDEATSAISGGQRHLLYITNRSIRDGDFNEFLLNRYKHKGEVDVSLVDLRKLVSALAQPGVLQRAYEILGFQVGGKIEASIKDVALSNFLLFSDDAREFKKDVFEANIKAFVYKNPQCNQDDLISALCEILPGSNVAGELMRAFASLQSRGVLGVSSGLISLSEGARLQMEASEKDYLSSIQMDIEGLSKKYGLSMDDAKRLIEIALELIAREERVDGDDVYAIELSKFISEKGLLKRKQAIFDDLSEVGAARVASYSRALAHVFSTNTFDIYRALGRNVDIVMLLDSSVAMPMIFGLAFGAARSRYGLAADALQRLCKEHGISIKVPRCYLNEMAKHGINALDFVDKYNALDGDLKNILRHSGNAYINHYSRIRGRSDLGEDFTLERFLRHFGVQAGHSLTRVANSIESVLSSFDIGVVDTGRWELNIRREVSIGKPPTELPIIIDNDASVATFLKSNFDHGYIFATWDRSLTKVVEGLSRIFAGSPASIYDFLSMAVGADYEVRRSVSLLSTLLYVDDAKALKIASEIDKIKTAQHAFELTEKIASLRDKDPAQFNIDDLDIFDIQQSQRGSNTPIPEG